jgi:hypothetical protein
VRRNRQDEPLSQEQRVFAECIDDVLASTPGLRYAALFDPQEIGRRDPEVYAQFLLQTSPVHDLALSIELMDRAFVIRVNGRSFSRKRGVGARFEWWVERRCRDLERLVGGSLRVTHQTLLNLPVTGTLEAGRGKKWRKIATFENGWIAFLSFLVPYGFILGGKRQLVYEDWFAAGDDA